MFRANEAGWDRVLRVLLAGTMVYWGLSGQVSTPWDLAASVFALYPAITALMGWDPVYVLVGFRGTKSPADR